MTGEKAWHRVIISINPKGVLWGLSLCRPLQGKRKVKVNIKVTAYKYIQDDSVRHTLWQQFGETSEQVYFSFLLIPAV